MVGNFCGKKGKMKGEREREGGVEVAHSPPLPQKDKPSTQFLSRQVLKIIIAQFTTISYVGARHSLSTWGIVCPHFFTTKKKDYHILNIVMGPIFEKLILSDKRDNIIFVQKNPFDTFFYKYIKA